MPIKIMYILKKIYVPTYYFNHQPSQDGSQNRWITPKIEAAATALKEDDLL